MTKRLANTQSLVAILVASLGILFATTLLVNQFVNQISFITLVALFLTVSLLIYLAERLREFSLRDLSVKLDEIKENRAEAEALYSKIDHLQKTTMVLDAERLSRLGGSGMPPSVDATMRYCAGCIKRERERLARVFAESKAPAVIAQAILDATLDDNVFKWTGPEAPLEPVVDFSIGWR